MRSVRPILKGALDKFEQDFQAANLPEGKFIKPPLHCQGVINWVNYCLMTNYKLNTDFTQICISPKPSRAPMFKVLLQVVKEFEHQASQNLCTLNFSAAFTQVISECNLVMENCKDSIKATVNRSNLGSKRVPILKN